MHDGLFEDAENDPLWQMAGLLADAPPRPVSKGYGRVFAGMAGAGAAGGPHAHPPRRGPADLPGVPLRRSNTVPLSNGELGELGISRYAKYRALAWLREAGVIAIEEANTRRSVRVTLLWFP